MSCCILFYNEIISRCRSFVQILLSIYLFAFCKVCIFFTLFYYFTIKCIVFIMNVCRREKKWKIFVDNGFITINCEDQRIFILNMISNSSETKKLVCDIRLENRYLKSLKMRSLWQLRVFFSPMMSQILSHYT